MGALSRALVYVSLLLFLGGGVLVAIGLASAHQPTFNPHRTTATAGNANAAPYVPGYRVFSNELGTGYASQHSDAIDAWNEAITQNQYLQVYSSPLFPATNFLALTYSLEDQYIQAIFDTSCGELVDANPDLVFFRAFDFGMIRHPTLDDNKFTIICLNHSSYTNCIYPAQEPPATSTCFNSPDVSYATQVIGLTHEFGHVLHLGHPCGQGA